MKLKGVLLALWVTLCLSVAVVAEGRAYGAPPTGGATGSTCSYTGTADVGSGGALVGSVSLTDCVPAEGADLLAVPLRLVFEDETETEIGSGTLVLCFFDAAATTACDFSTTTDTFASGSWGTVSVPSGTELAYFTADGALLVCAEGESVLDDCVDGPSYVTAEFTMTGPYASGGGGGAGPFGDGAELFDMATDVSTFGFTVLLPGVLIAMAAGAALRLIFKAVRRVTASVG